jgi:hypothetical protein
MIAAIRQVNRLELAGETLRAALNEIATVAPEWLKQIISEDWYSVTVGVLTITAYQKRKTSGNNWRGK